MSEVGRSVRGISVAMVCLFLAGPVTAALADGRPTPVLPEEQQVIQGPRPGFGDRIQPPRPGFGDRIQPVVPARPTMEVPATVAHPVPAGHGGAAPFVGLVAGLILLTGLVVVVNGKRIGAHTG